MTYPTDRIVVTLSSPPPLLPIRARKVGGIWFARAWRLRVSFCIAR
jgi:hypothetical protein